MNTTTNMKDIALCVDIGGTSIKFTFIDTEGNILVTPWSIPTNLNNSGETIPEEIARELNNKLAEFTDVNVIGLGVGVPGFATKDGKVRFSGNIGWRDYDITTYLKKHFNVPIAVHNDCDMAALGEKFIGAGKDLDDFTFITLGTGMGAGLFINGDLYLGAGGTAGELGHVPIQGRNPKFQCTCGLPECIEPAFSATGLINIYNSIANENPELKKLDEINGKTIWEGVDKGDELCEKAAREFAEYGGRSLAAAAMTLNPEAIILGGGLSLNNKIMLKYLTEVYERFTHEFISDTTKIVLCEVGNDSALYGAAYAVFKKTNNILN